MAYLQSNKIKAFPVVTRNTAVSGDVYARHTSEELLSGIVNKLIDADGFVITQQEDFVDKDGKETLPFLFNVHGYYFKVEQLKDLLMIASDLKIKTSNIIWARIKVEKNGLWWEIAGGDDPIEDSGNNGSINPVNYSYSGVDFSVRPENDIPIPERSKLYEEYYTPLLQKVEPKSYYDWNPKGDYPGYRVLPQGYLKFSGKSFVLERVDGGNLDKSILSD